MSQHAYPKNAIMGDYLRGGLGFAVTAVPVILTPMLGTFQIIFGLVSLVFAGFLFKTWQKAQTRYEVDEEAIRATGPMTSSAIRWQDLVKMNLRYFSTQKDKSKGWMQLLLKDRAGTKITIESTLDGFDTVLEHAAKAARKNEIALDPTTIDNLAASGTTLGLAAGSR